MVSLLAGSGKRLGHFAAELADCPSVERVSLCCGQPRKLFDVHGVERMMQSATWSPPSNCCSTGSRALLGAHAILYTD